MKIKRCELYNHVKSYEGKTDLTGFLGFIDSPIRELRVKPICKDKIRLHYIDANNNIQRVDVTPDDESEVDFPLNP